MPNHLELRIFILYMLAVAIFLGIQVYEPYPFGTGDAYAWDFYQGMILPPIAAFITTIMISGLGGGKPWLTVSYTIMIGWIIFTMDANDLWWGFQLAVIFYGISSGVAAVLYITFKNTLTMGEMHADELLKNCEESDTSDLDEIKKS